MVKVTVTDNTVGLQRALEDIAKMQVYVGVPEEKSSREPGTEKPEGINNAELAFLLTNGVRAGSMRREMKKDVQENGYHAAYDMYIHSHGSPLWRTPPRPIVEPAIEDDRENISGLMKMAAEAALDGDKEKATEYLNKAGLEGQKAAQDWFTNPKNGWAPNAESTINGWTAPWEDKETKKAKFFEGKGSNRPNIDTGELRKAITYVVKER
jgi:hypothetical protein